MMACRRSWHYVRAGSRWILSGGVAMAVEAAPVHSHVIRVRDGAGAPLENAVVTWTPESGVAIPAPLEAEIVQAGQQFLPLVTVLPVGSRVAFPNRDTTAHHVYSFSAAKQFDLPLYTGESPQAVVFEVPGIVTLGCNIHDWMTAYIVLVETPWYGITGENGTVRFEALPLTAGRLQVWHPRQRSAAPPVRWQPSAASGPELSLNVRPDTRRRGPPDLGRRGGYR